MPPREFPLSTVSCASRVCIQEWPCCRFLNIIEPDAKLKESHIAVLATSKPHKTWMDMDHFCPPKCKKDLVNL